MAANLLPFAQQPERDQDAGGAYEENTLDDIVEAMLHRGPPAIQAVRQFARALDAMAVGMAMHNYQQVQNAAYHACVAFGQISDDDGELTQ